MKSLPILLAITLTCFSARATQFVAGSATLFATVGITQFTNEVSGGVGGGGPSLTCQTDIALISPNDNHFFGAGSVAQKVPGTTGGRTICKVYFNCSGSGNGHCELWSGIDGSGNGTGTQYGANSADTSLGGMAVYAFTWSSNPVIPPNTDYYLIFTGSTAFESKYPPAVSGYAYYFNGTVDSGSCLSFGIDSMQP